MNKKRMAPLTLAILFALILFSMQSAGDVSSKGLASLVRAGAGNWRIEASKVKSKAKSHVF